MIYISDKIPRVNVDIIVERNGKILLGLLTEKWTGGKEMWGLPGRDILFGEKIIDTVKRNLKEEFGDITVKNYKIISVNSNFALGNHYIGIGGLVEMKGEIEHKIKEDWKKWKWFSKNKIPENLFSAAKNQVECYLTGKISVSE